jgi:hypothetical protein
MLESAWHLRYHLCAWFFLIGLVRDVPARAVDGEAWTPLVDDAWTPVDNPLSDMTLSVIKSIKTSLQILQLR